MPRPLWTPNPSVPSSSSSTTTTYSKCHPVAMDTPCNRRGQSAPAKLHQRLMVQQQHQHTADEDVPSGHQVQDSPAVSGHAKCVESGHVKLESGNAKLESGHAWLESGHGQLESGHARLESGHTGPPPSPPKLSGRSTPPTTTSAGPQKAAAPSSSSSSSSSSEEVRRLKRQAQQKLRQEEWKKKRSSSNNAATPQEVGEGLGAGPPSENDTIAAIERELISRGLV